MDRTNWMLIGLLSTLFLGGCAQKGPHRTYPAGSIGSAMQVQRGEVLAIDTVTIDGRHSVIGTLGGAAIGNSIGRTVVGGSGKRVAGAVGAVGGAVAGRAVEGAVTTQTAVEVTVELDNGQVIAIVQNGDETLNKGDRVRVLMGRRTNRVVPL